MAAQADSASPAGGAELSWFWRIALVGGLTLAVVLIWSLREPAAPPSLEAVAAAPAVLETRPPAAAPTIAEPPQSAAVPQAAAAAPAAEAAIEQAAPVEWPEQSGIIPGRPDPAAPPRPADFERYIVQRGETLVLIAALRGVTLDDLLRFNPELGDGSMLNAGAAIWIPIWEAVDDDAP